MSQSTQAPADLDINRWPPGYAPDHSSPAVSAELARYARGYGRFAHLGYSHPGPGKFSTAYLADGATTYATARGRTPAQACINLLVRVRLLGPPRAEVVS